MLASPPVCMVAVASGRRAGQLGRKPLFIFALAARGVLCTCSHQPAALIAVQCLDGLGTGIFGVVGVLIIADLSKGTGSFNAAQGLGAFLSNLVAGYLAKSHGDGSTFLTLAGIVSVGLVLFWVCMPETLDKAEAAQPVARS